MKSFDSVGLWFLPSDPDTQVAGTLTFAQDNGLTLKLTGSFQSNLSIDSATYPIIHGVVNESPYGNAISLFNSFATNLHIGMPGISLETVHANHGYAGTDFVESESTPFHSASLSFSPLAAWLDYSGLTLDRVSEPTALTARWDRPEQVQCKLGGATISTAFGCVGHRDLSPRIVSIEEIPSLVINDLGGATALEIHERFVGPLSWLMAFVAERTSTLQRYSLTAKKNGTQEQFRVDRLYAPIGFSEMAGRNKAPGQLFTLADVPGGFESFVPSWFRFVETHPAFSATFFSHAYEENGLLEGRFLLRMLAMECLIQEDELENPIVGYYSNSRDAILKAAILESDPYAEFGAPTAIQMAMPSLLAQVVCRHWSLVEDVIGTTEERFVESLFATRRCLGHRGARPAGAMAGANLFWLLERLSCVLKICVLTDIGFPNERIAGIVAGNARMAHLKSIPAPWDTPNGD